MRALAFALVTCFALPHSALAEQSTREEPEEPTKGTLPVPPRWEKPEVLKPLKISGYVQGRFTWDERSRHDAVQDGFAIRRARIKPEYMTERGGVMIELDMTARSVSLKSAEARFKEAWTPLGIEFALGQMKWPFGFEVDQSSSKRELPERSRVVRAFFAGERDRGARISADVGVVRLSGGVFEGNGIDNTGFIGRDNDRYKDGVARLGVDLGWLSGGVSGWYGRTVAPLDEDAPSSLSERTFDRNRLGADLQLKGRLIPFGDTELRLEGIAGKTYFQSGVEQFGVPALGGYAVLVQELHPQHKLAFRYDVFDPAAGTPNLARPDDPTRPASSNQLHTAGFAWVYEHSKQVRLTLAYELPVTQGPDGAQDPSDNLFTAQLQASY